MPRRVSVGVTHANSGQYNGNGTQYLVQANNGALYLVSLGQELDIQFCKSTDGGVSWTAPTVVFAGSAVALSVWYDRWSDVASDRIHMAYTESATADTLYRTIDTASSDALSTQTTIFAGASSAATSGHLSITRAKGGNVYCKTVIDAGAEGGFYRLANANVPNGAWDAARTVDEAIATSDQMILVPNLTAADTQDIMAIFWDSSASEVSRKLYDDSANSWGETSIATSMTRVAGTVAWPQFAAAVDITNSQIILVAWSAADTLNADLRCWTITDSAITAKTDVVTNSTDDQGMAAIGIDTSTGYWHAAYFGITTGGETWTTAMKMYAKVSTDSGTTWGTETAMTSDTISANWLAMAPRFTGQPVFAHYNVHNTIGEIRVSVDHSLPRATYVAGIF